MINQIKSNKKLSAYLSHNIEDAGMQIEVDNALSEDEYIGIKLDDYYMGLKLGGETPKAVDFIVAVDCECDSYALYILELKNVKSAQQFTTKDIEDKFETAVCRFMDKEYKDIFKNPKYKYKQVKLYLVSSAYLNSLGAGTFEEYAKLLKKIGKKDSLTKDIHLSYKAFYFYGMRLFIDREIPPNPVIKKIV